MFKNLREENLQTILTNIPNTCFKIILYMITFLVSVPEVGKTSLFRKAFQI